MYLLFDNIDRINNYIEPVYISYFIDISLIKNIEEKILKEPPALYIYKITLKDGRFIKSQEFHRPTLFCNLPKLEEMGKVVIGGARIIDKLIRNKKKFIELYRTENNRVISLDVDCITLFKPHEDGKRTIIWINNLESIIVNESYDEVYKEVNKGF